MTAPRRPGGQGLRTVEEHLADVLAGLVPLAPEGVAIAEAAGRVLAEDLLAPVDLPRFDNSAMDGYAVRVDDLAGADPGSPVRLDVVGDLPAGPVRAAYEVTPGTAVRIMTGAPVPAGTEAVVPVELTDGGTGKVAVTGPVRPGQHVRRRGEDVRAGDLLLPAGTRLGPVEVGLVAAAGVGVVTVRRRPRVVVLSTGSELVEPGSPVRPGEITESNGHLLVAAARAAGADAVRATSTSDDPDATRAALLQAADGADLVVTSGGVSAGAYDVVKEVLDGAGVRFAKVAMQPGMPQGCGRYGPAATPIVTLPGNPVSAYVSFEIFVRPAIRRLLGAVPLHRPTVPAVCGQDLTASAGKRQYLRARLEAADGHLVVRPVGGRGSHLLRDLARSDALLIVPEATESLVAGDLVDVLPLGDAFAGTGA